VIKIPNPIKITRTGLTLTIGFAFLCPAAFCAGVYSISILSGLMCVFILYIEITIQ